MSESFPFFAIAQKHNVPYGEVLRLVDCWEHSQLRHNSTPLFEDVARACRIEQSRRKFINSGTATNTCNVTFPPMDELKNY